MRAQGLNFQFEEGLSPEAQVGRNTAFLSELKNLKITRRGLVRDERIKRIDQAVDWPFPQFFQNGQEGVLAFSDQYYETDFNGVPTLDAVDGLDLGGVWRFAAGGSGSFILTNGAVLTGRIGDVPFDFRTATIQGACCHGDRFVLAGFDPVAYQGGVEDVLYDYPTDGNANLNPLANAVSWSSVGGWDLLGMTMPVGDYLKMGEAGFLPLPFPALSVHELQDLVVVYGTGGAGVLNPMIDPVPGYGFSPRPQFPGLWNRSSVAGDNQGHVAVDCDRALWRIDQGGKFARLGYVDYIGKLRNPIVVSKHQSRDEFWISDGTRSFVLSEKGLSESTECPTSLWINFDGLHGIVAERSADEIDIKTGPIDFGVSGLKEIITVEAVGSNLNGLFVEVEAQYGDGSFEKFPAVPVNGDGFAVVKAAGECFSIRIAGTPTAHDCSLDRLLVEWNRIDRRNVRGQR